MPADLTVTAANVRPLHGAIVRRFDAGGSMNVGDCVYIAADGDVEVTDADSISTTWLVGLVVGTPSGATAIVAGNAVDVVVYGPVAGFSSLTPGALGYVSGTAGAINDTVGTKDAIVGYAESDEIFFVRPQLIDLS
jgi:hypothetical protein